MNRTVVILALLVPLLGGCDQLKERMGIPDPAKQQAEGKAIGAACRNAGQGLEDCYRLNPDTGKADIYAGWKEMNEYMTKNNMPVIPPNATLQADGSVSSPPAEPASTPAPAAASTSASAPAPTPAPPADAGHAPKAKTEAKPKAEAKTAAKTKADAKHDAAPN